MLINASSLKGFGLSGLDGEIGKVKEFFFDDQFWAVRYLVADTGNWLTDRQVLISPHALLAINNEEQHINVKLTKSQIEDSPPLNSDKPVSRQFEEAYYGYHGFSPYWIGTSMWGYYPSIVTDPAKWMNPAQDAKTWDPHLRSTYDVMGHNIQALNGEIGHVKDFIIDDEMWAIRYLVIDTQNWWPGKTVLLSPQWLERISWEESKVFVNLSQEAIQQSPEFTDKLLLNRKYEEDLHRYYKRHAYWDDVPLI